MTVDVTAENTTLAIGDATFVVNSLIYFLFVNPRSCKIKGKVSFSSLSSKSGYVNGGRESVAVPFVAVAKEDNKIIKLMQIKKIEDGFILGSLI